VRGSGTIREGVKRERQVGREKRKGRKRERKRTSSGANMVRGVPPKGLRRRENEKSPIRPSRREELKRRQPGIRKIRIATTSCKKSKAKENEKREEKGRKN